MAEVAVPQDLFRSILRRIDQIGAVVASMA
jgi:hypothetical protein